MNPTQEPKVSAIVKAAHNKSGVNSFFYQKFADTEITKYLRCSGQSDGQQKKAYLCGVINREMTMVLPS